MHDAVRARLSAVRQRLRQRRAALNDPKQQVRAGGVALSGEIELTDWLKFRTITA